MNRNRQRARDVGSDRLAARSTAAGRLAVLLGVATAGSFVGRQAEPVEVFLLLVALVAVPWAVVVLFISEGPGRPPLLARTAWVGDLATIFALVVFMPQQQRTGLLISLAVVAISGYVARSLAPWVIPTAAVTLTLAAQLVVDAAYRVPANELVLYAVILGAVSLLMNRVGGQQRWAAARAEALEGRAGAILNTVADAIVLTDLAGITRTLNPAARRLVGTEGGAGSRCADLLQLHDGERLLSCQAGCALLGLRGSADGIRLWRPRADGGRQPLLASAAVVRGSLAGDEVVHSLRDITKLMEVEEAKTLFLATTSHELKTPITVIKGFAESLARHPDADPELFRTALDAISRRSDELSKIVDRLLMSSRIDAGQLSVPIEQIDVAPVICERVSAMQAATGRTVALEVGELPPAFANTDAVATIVDHLLDNALKYTPTGKSVFVDAGVEPFGEGLVIRVRDEGVGMDPTQLDHCFDRFWQADSGSARRFGGTGIGLYIVRSLVDAIHATISVRSSLGVGTEFTVVIPVEEQVRVPEQSGPQPPASEPSMIREFMRQIGVPAGADG